MNDHIPDITKMIGDTQISDSTPHNVADLGMLCMKLERELNEANERIKRLEEAGDELMYDNDDMTNINRWHKAKETKS